MRASLALKIELAQRRDASMLSEGLFPYEKISQEIYRFISAPTRTSLVKSPQVYKFYEYFGVRKQALR